MNQEAFIRAMPKVELNIRLEGSFRKKTLLTIADQNEIPGSVKRFKDWVELLDHPDYRRIDEITLAVASWLRHPDDLTRLVYDLGVDLSKQNVKYAEVLVNPVTHMLPGMSFEEFLTALNDGRDRVQRAWGTRLAWILVVPRDEPRRADDVARWVTSTIARRGEVAAMGLVGREDIQPVGQFERAFSAVHKKDIPSVVDAGNAEGAKGILQALDHLAPSRVINGWGAIDAPDVLQRLSDDQIPLVISISRALCLNWIETFASYPLRDLYAQNIRVVISADMPSFFKSTLTDEYIAAVEHGGLTLDELQEIALNAIHGSFLPADERVKLLVEFSEEFERLRSELEPSEAS